MATNIITKNKETFIKTKKDYKGSLALSRSAEAILQNALSRLALIMVDPKVPVKEQMEAIRVVIEIEERNKKSRNEDQIMRLKLELEHLEELAMQQDASLGFEEPDEDDEDVTDVAVVDFSKIVEIE